MSTVIHHQKSVSHFVTIIQFPTIPPKSVRQFIWSNQRSAVWSRGHSGQSASACGSLSSAARASDASQLRGTNSAASGFSGVVDRSIGADVLLRVLLAISIAADDDVDMARD